MVDEAQVLARRDELLSKQDRLTRQEIDELNELQRTLRTKFNYTPREAPNLAQRKGKFYLRQGLKEKTVYYQDPTEEQKKASDKALTEGKGTTADVFQGYDPRALSYTPQTIQALRERAQVNQDVQVEQQNKQIDAYNKYLEWDATAKRQTTFKDNENARKARILGLPNTEQGREIASSYPVGVDSASQVIGVLNKSEKGTSTLQFEKDFAVGLAVGTKTLLFDVPVDIAKSQYYLATGQFKKAVETNPVSGTLYTGYKVATDKETRQGVISELARNVITRPGYVAGQTVAFIEAPAITRAGVQTGLRIGEVYLESTKGILRSKKGAVFRGSTSSRAGERVSPVSNVQKSKIARRQAYDPNITQIGETIIKRSGRARVNVDRSTPISATGDYRLDITRKAPRSDVPESLTTSFNVNVKKAFDIRQGTEQNVGLLSPAKYSKTITRSDEISFTSGVKNKGSVNLRRPARSESFDLGSSYLKQNQIIVLENQKITRSNRTKRQPTYKQDPNLMNPSGLAQPLLKSDRVLDKYTTYFEQADKRRPINKREARLQAKKAELKAKREAQLKQEAQDKELFYQNLAESSGLNKKLTKQQEAELNAKIGEQYYAKGDTASGDISQGKKNIFEVVLEEQKASKSIVSKPKNILEPTASVETLAEVSKKNKRRPTIYDVEYVKAETINVLPTKERPLLEAPKIKDNIIDITAKPYEGYKGIASSDRKLKTNRKTQFKTTIGEKVNFASRLTSGELLKVSPRDVALSDSRLKYGSAVDLSQKNKINTNFDLYVRNNLVISPSVSYDVKPSQMIGYGQGSKSKQDQTQGFALSQIQAQAIKPDTKQKTKRLEKNKPKPVELVRPVIIDDFNKVPPVGYVPPIKPKPPTKKGGNIPRIKNPFIRPTGTPRTTEKRQKNILGGFGVYVRRKGKFSKVSTATLTKESALGLGSFIVGNTASASFKIVPESGQAIEQPRKGSLSDFYTKDNIFIEKRSRRIKSAGEKLEITQKGIFSTKYKNRNDNKKIGIFKWA